MLACGFRGFGPGLRGPVALDLWQLNPSLWENEDASSLYGDHKQGWGLNASNFTGTSP